MSTQKSSPILDEKLSETLFLRIIDKIDRKKLVQHDRLGTERELAKEFGVSVRAVREAAARLQALGILRARQGVGLLVSCPNPASVLARMLPLYAAHHGTLEDLYQLRRALELGVIDVAVRNASDEHLKRLMKLAQEHEPAAAENRVGRRKESGLMFHRTILEATGNEFVREMAGVLEEYFTRAAREVAGWSKRHDTVTHRQIAEAFVKRDEAKAWSLMRKHLRSWKSAQPNVPD